MTCLAGAGVVGDQQGGLVVAQAGNGELADRAGVGRQRGGGVVVDLDAAGLAAGPAQGHGFPGAGGQGGQGFGDAGVAGAQGDEPDLAVVEFGEDGLGGELGVEDQQRRVVPGDLFQWSANAMTSRFWLALDRSALA